MTTKTSAKAHKTSYLDQIKFNSHAQVCTHTLSAFK